MIQPNNKSLENDLSEGFVDVKRSRRILNKSIDQRHIGNPIPKKKAKQDMSLDDDSDDDDLKIVCCIDPIKWFFPIHENWQRAKCAKFDLILKKTLNFDCDDPIPATEPSKIQEIEGDGNCYFRCLSYLITGEDKSHKLIRRKLVKFMRENKEKIEGLGGKNYVNKSQMWIDAMWPTEVEIYASACMLDTDIFTYMGEGKWLRFSSSGKLELSDKVERSIYLQNTENVHYDVVLAVTEPKLLPPNKVYSATRNVQATPKKNVPIKHDAIDISDSSALTLEITQNKSLHTLDPPRFSFGPRKILDVSLWKDL